MFREIKNFFMIVGDGQFFSERGHYSLVNYVLGGTIFSEGGHRTKFTSEQCPGGQKSCTSE